MNRASAGLLDREQFKSPMVLTSSLDQRPHSGGSLKPARAFALEALTRDPRASLGFAAVLLLATVLRFADIGGKSMWLDEAFSVALSGAPWTTFAHMLRTQEANMALYYVLLRIWLHLGRDEATVRALSAIVGILTIPVIYALGSYVFSRPVGLGAAFLLAIDPLQLWAAQEARGYSLAVFLVTCSTWAFVHLVDKGTSRQDQVVPPSAPGAPSGPSRRTFWWAALYACTSALALYSHFYSAFVLLAQWLSLTARPRWGKGEGWWGPLLASAVAAGLLLIPLALFFLSGPHSNIDWMRDVMRTVIPRTIMAAHTIAGFVAIIGYTGIVIAVIVVAAVTLRGDRAPERWGRLLMLLWATIPIVIPLAVTLLIKPILDPRYLTVCLPGFALTAAAMFATRRRTGPLLWGVVAVLVLLEVSADWGYFARVRKEDWRDATRDVLADARTGDVAVFYAPYVRRAFDYYADRANSSGRPDAAPVILYPDTVYTNFKTSGPATTLGSAIDRARKTAFRTWIVLSHHTGAADAACAGVLDAVLRPTFPEIEERSYPTVTVRLYSRSPGSTGSTDPAAAERPPDDAAVARACPQS
jgi:mannosyltransferase